MFSSAFQRALTVAQVHSVSKDSSFMANPIDAVKQSEDRTSELTVYSRTLINRNPSKESEGHSLASSSSERLGSIESLSYKALPDLPVCQASGTSSELASPPPYDTENQVSAAPTNRTPFIAPVVEAQLPDNRNATSLISSSSSALTESSLPDDSPNTLLDTSVIIKSSIQPSVGPDPCVSIITPIVSLDSNEKDITSHSHPNLKTLRDSPAIQTKNINPGDRLRTRKSTSSFPTFLHSIAVSNADSSAQLPHTERDNEESTRRRKRVLQPIVESNSSTFSTSPKSYTSPVAPSIRGLDTSFAKKMEEAGRLRRLQSQSSIKSAIRNTVSASASLDSDQISSAESQSHLKSYSEDDAKAEGRMLRDLLDRTLRELKDTREEAERVTAQITWEKSRLVKELKASNEDVRSLLAEKETQRQTITSLRSQMKKNETELNAIKKEKKTWQDQLDSMHHRVVHAERRMRRLDNLTHSKLEARMEGAFGSTRRSEKAATSKDASAEVVGAVIALNEEILQTSNLLVEILERSLSTGSNANILRAKAVVGSTITNMMQRQERDGFKFLLVQVALETFMVHWCTHIIEGSYPRQKSFADLLIDLSSQTSKPNSGHVPLANTSVNCGKVKILEMTTSMADKFPEWVSEIIQDLWKILSAGGLRLKFSRGDLLTSKLLMLVKMAYDTRTALAEKDICGDLDIVVVSPDYPFQEKWMDEAHHDKTSRKNTSSSTTETNLVAGISGLGLQRSPADANGKASTSNTVMILKPKVVLASVLKESL